MRRCLTILLLLVLTLPARAVQVILPIYPTGEAQQTPTASQALNCGRFVMPDTVLSLSRVTVNITTGFGGAVLMGFALYPDLDGGTAIFSAGSQPAVGSGVVSATVTAFDLTGGVTYRLCFCATGTSGAYAAPRWLSGATSVAALQNAIVPSVGVGTMSCDASANPPATTGAIVPNNAVVPPLVAAE